MRVLIDACVLYPTLLRTLVLSVAGTGAFVPLWSARIVEEWRRAALRTHPDRSAALEGEIALVQARWPAATVVVPEGAEDLLSLPDENDRHVLAAAIAGQATLILTLNLRDFPGRTLARQELRAEHPDPMLLGLYRDDPDGVGAALCAELKLAARHTGKNARSLLKKSRLPRLAKALVPAG